MILTIEDLDNEYRVRWTDAAEKNGGDISSSEEAELAVWYRAERLKLIQGDNPPEFVAKDKTPAPKKEKKQTPAPTGARTCVDCGAALTKKPGPGRWPKRCKDCK